MKKKAISLIMAVTMLSSLIGCEKKSSIEPNEMIKNPFGDKTVKSIDADIEVNISAKIDMTGMFGKKDERNLEKVSLEKNMLTKGRLPDISHSTEEWDEEEEDERPTTRTTTESQDDEQISPTTSDSSSVPTSPNLPSNNVLIPTDVPEFPSSGEETDDSSSLDKPDLGDLGVTSSVGRKKDIKDSESVLEYTKVQEVYNNEDVTNVTNNDTDDEDMAMNVALKCTANIKANDEIIYTKGEGTYSFLGMTETSPFESYVTIDKENENIISYQYNEDDNIWYKSYSKNEDDNNLISTKDFSINDTVIKGIKPEIVSDVKCEKDKSNYVIKGTITPKTIMDNYEIRDELETLAKSEIDTIGDFDIEAIEFDTTLRYNKNKELEQIVIFMDTESINIPSVEISKFEIIVNINSINKIELKISEEIDKNAEELEDDDFFDSLDNNLSNDEIYDITDSNENIGDNYINNTNEQNLSMMVFGKPNAANEDIIAAISGTYMDQPTMEVINAMTNILNTNTVSRLKANLKSYDNWNQANKTAITYFYGLGVFTLDDLVNCGADKDYILSEYNSIHQVPDYTPTTEEIITSETTVM